MRVSVNHGLSVWRSDTFFAYFGSEQRAKRSSRNQAIAITVTGDIADLLLGVDGVDLKARRRRQRMLKEWFYV